MEAMASLEHSVEVVLKSLDRAGISRPASLWLLGSGGHEHGLPILSSHSLREHDCPAHWRSSQLQVGTHAGRTFWLLEDVGDVEGFRAAEDTQAGWQRAFPVWLAAEAGAQVCVHTFAGLGLHERWAREPAGLFLVRDHLNLSGGTPLLGVGETRLGPMFPDQTRLHDPGLALRAQARAQDLGLALPDGVLACLAGPAITTGAEIAWLKNTPAHAAAQDVAGPLIAAAHAGLSMLAIGAICDAGQRPVNIASLLESIDATAGPMRALLASLLPDVMEAALTISESQ